MIVSSITELQPYLTLAGTVLSVATLGFVLNVARLMTDAAQSRAEILRERLQKSQEEVQRTEKWSEREKAVLQKEVSSLQAQLAGAGVTTTLQAKEVDTRLSIEVKEALEKQSAELRALLTSKSENDSHIDPAAALQLGRSYLAIGNWELATRYLGDYLANQVDDWEAQYARGVAYANMHGDRKTNLAALRSYNEAMAFGAEPNSGMTSNNRGRLFIYRGAILKRMGRLDEAERDIRLGAAIASGDYEKADASYNLAAIFALRNDKEQLLALLRNAKELVEREYLHKAILGHIDGYFSHYSKDVDFIRSLAELKGHTRGSSAG